MAASRTPPARWLIAAGFALSSGCGPPTLDSLNPTSGGPHTLVEADGATVFSTIYWDAGTASEQSVPGRFLASDLFSVPHGAPTGGHAVELERAGGRSAPSTFTVTDPADMPFPSPRLEYLSVWGWRETSPGQAEFLLFAQGADVDVGAEILVDGTVQETAFWQGLRNGLGGVDPTTLDFPPYHYGLVLTAVDAAIGSSLDISIRNLGGAVSNTMAFTVPAAAELDSDGDGLLDEWEENGYDADGDGTVDVDLPALGAHPHHKDVFVEVDFMSGKVPADDPWTIVEDAFAAAPVLNVAGGPGIHLHIDRGQATGTALDGTALTIPAAERDGGTILPQSDYIRFDGAASPCAAAGETTVNFHTLKSTAANFDPDRLEVFHYAIIADRHGYSCAASGRGEIWGNDLFVTLRDVRLAVEEFVAGTFMHELGHNLNLRHGGGDDADNTQREPNHVSVMSYYTSDGTFTGSYQVGGVDVDCDRVADAVYDYSRGALNDLDESSLDEADGMCDGVAIDWNGVGGSAESGIPVDISADGSLGTLDDFNSWGRLYLDFRATGSGWGGN